MLSRSSSYPKKTAQVAAGTKDNSGANLGRDHKQFGAITGYRPFDGRDLERGAADRRHRRNERDARLGPERTKEIGVRSDRCPQARYNHSVFDRARTLTASAVFRYRAGRRAVVPDPFDPAHLHSVWAPIVGFVVSVASVSFSGYFRRGRPLFSTR